MMDHWEERGQDPSVASGVSVMVKLFSERLGLSWVERRDVEHCYGVLKTNAVDVMDGMGQALFPKRIDFNFKLDFISATQ